MILLLCYGVYSLVGLSAVSFPASVACMIVLFFALLLSQSLLGDKKTRATLSVIEVPAGFALRWINIFFCPSFVLLPLSPPVSGVEVGKIIAVLFVGFVVMMCVTAYLTRGLQLLLGSSKRTMTERAEEMGDENDMIPLTQRNNSMPSELPSRSASMSGLPSSGLPSPSSPDDLASPGRAQDPSQVTGTGGPPVDDRAEEIQPFILRQNPIPPSRAQNWAAKLNAHLDLVTYGILFIVSLPVYYAADYAMPTQLTLTVLAYFAALALPPKWRRFLHPVMVSSAVTIVGIWVLALCRGDSLQDGLGAYSTKARYFQLWDGGSDLRRPGAGDVFGSILDVSIVALALPMFQYRKELNRHVSSQDLVHVASSSLTGRS